MLSTRTYYEATVEPSPPRPGLTGQIRADVAIVGAGYAGLNAALELAQTGYKVVLLEAGLVGNGGSGRNGGQLLPGMAAHAETMIAEAGLEGAKRLFQLSLDGVALVRERVAKFGIACDLTEGYAAAAVRPHQLDELKRGIESQERDFGYDKNTLWSASEIEQALGSRRYVGGAYDSGGAHLHPLRYAQGLARAVEAAGGTIHENSAVLSVEPGPSPRLTTATGTLSAAHAILAGGALLAANTLPALRRTVLTIPSGIVATAPLADPAIMARNIAVYDLNLVLDYYRTSANRRLLFGGRALGRNATPQDIAGEFAKRIVKVFPSLRGIAIEHAWTGLLDMTANRLPHFGWHAPNILFAQGFSGHGVNMASIAGAILADAVRGTAERFDLFAKVRHRQLPTGRTAQSALFRLAMTYFRLKDAL
jgi:gamma-glutamylputrescine oxidase